MISEAKTINTICQASDVDYCAKIRSELSLIVFKISRFFTSYNMMILFAVDNKFSQVSTGTIELNLSFAQSTFSKTRFVCSVHQLFWTGDRHTPLDFGILRLTTVTKANCLSAKIRF